MPRAIWSGTISFGLVNVPVKLFTATESKDVHFSQFEPKSGKRVKYKRVVEGTNREVEFDDIVKGYEVKKGQFVLVEPDELEAAAPEKTKTIEIEDFVDLAEIDPIHFEKTYYVAPEGSAGAQKAYALLLKAMQQQEKVAIGRFVMRTKEYLVAVRPIRSGVLALETLYFHDEIRAVSDIPNLPVKANVTPKERSIAERLIESLTTEWKPSRYRDTYREAMLEVIERKAEGEEIVVEAAEKAAPVTDLLAALEASLEAARGKAAKSSAKRPAKGAARSTKAKKAS